VSVRDAFDALLAASTPLESVRATRAASAELDASLLGIVREALDSGATWDEVADAAGLSPAASKWRWQGTDADIEARIAAGRKRSQRPSSVPTDLPGLSVAEAARSLGITPQAVYLRVSRGQLRAEIVTIADGRSYKRVFVSDEAAE
jgi:transposase-like protein